MIKMGHTAESAEISVQQYFNEEKRGELSMFRHLHSIELKFPDA